MGHSEISESRADVGGISTRVLEVAGDGPPIVLLHGFSDSADSWRPLLREFAARSRRAVAADMPGSGHAPALARPALASLDAFAAAFVDRYADSPPILVGHSLGGLVALRAAQLGQLPLRSVVGIGPAGLVLGPRLERVDRWGRPLTPLLNLLFLLPVPGPVLRCGAVRYYHEHLAEKPVDASLARSYASHLRGMGDIRRLWDDLLALGDDDRAAPLDLSKITVPVLLIWGRKDPLAAVEGAQRVLDAVPGSRLEVFEDCGHCPHVQVPGQIAGLIAEAEDVRADAVSQALAVSALPSGGLREETGNTHVGSRIGDVSDRG
jgi:pimeloyl-ACP methyl ester carboxylesterase